MNWDVYSFFFLTVFLKKSLLPISLATELFQNLWHWKIKVVLFGVIPHSNGASLVAQMVKKNLPEIQETWVLFLDREDCWRTEWQPTPVSQYLTWRIPWTEESDRLQSMVSQRVRHDWVTNPGTRKDKLLFPALDILKTERVLPWFFGSH